MGYKFFRYATDDGSGNPIFRNRDLTQLAIMEKGVNLTTIMGAGVTGDRLIVKANSIDASPNINMTGGGNFAFNSFNATIFNFGGVDAGYISGDADNFKIYTYTNNDIQLLPNGTGRLKFGAETTNAGSDRGKLVDFKLADGTTVYIKTYDTV